MSNIGFYILVSLPFVLLVGSYYNETGSLISAVAMLNGLMWFFGFWPSLIGYGFFLLLPGWGESWAVIVGLMVWLPGFLALMVLADWAEERAESRRYSR